MQVTLEDLPHLKLPLQQKENKGWPATPTKRQMELALEGLGLMDIVQELANGESPIPALTPKEGRTQHLMPVQGPNGRTASFDRFHERPMWLSKQLIFNPRKVHHAWWLNMCVQAVNMHEAALDTYRQLGLQTQEETDWFLQLAAELGDSRETIGIAMQKQSHDGQEHGLAFTKLMRHQVWMGYNPMLQNLEGMTFQFFAAHDNPNIPAQVIGRPTGTEAEEFPAAPVTTKSKETERGMLNRILKHHGADQCLWVKYPDSPYAQDRAHRTRD